MVADNDYDQRLSEAPGMKENFLTALTFSLPKTSSAHICRCSKSGGKKVTAIVGVFWMLERSKDGRLIPQWDLLSKSAKDRR